MAALAHHGNGANEQQMLFAKSKKLVSMDLLNIA
jgi:hypothetical protein